MGNCPANCETVQIIEPNNDLLVDTAGTTSDVDERGELVLIPGQTSADVAFQVNKLNVNYNFEYLYVDSPNDPHPGSVVPVPVTRGVGGFSVAFAGSPIGAGYVLHWRVTIARTSALIQTDAPESLYLQLPRAALMDISFVNPRSSVNYGFSELRVENLHDAPAVQTPIHVQVYQKLLTGFSIAINPTPPTDFYYLKVRTP